MYAGHRPKKLGGFLPGDASHFRVCGSIKESRMEFAKANKLYRKSGGSPTIPFFAIQRENPVPKIDSPM
jgi:hypothetical protein